MMNDRSPSLMLDLNQGWTLSLADHGMKAKVSVPFDVHTTLIDEGLIGDPYWRCREQGLDWIHEGTWTLARDIELTPEKLRIDGLAHHWTLSLTMLDCCATIRVNGQVAGDVASQFIRHDLDVTALLQPGQNRIEITFHSSSQKARDAASRFPFKLPYLEQNCRIGHVNHLRKTQCHAGWDWNIALMPLGIYGEVTLRRNRIVRLNEIKVVQHHETGLVRLSVTAYATGFEVAGTTFHVSLRDQNVTLPVLIRPGANRVEAILEIENPALWWPVGHGLPTLHDLTVRLGDETISRRVGLRNIELINTADAIGARFAIAVNGREIFMKGANWIPADALPTRATPDAVENLIIAAKAAHMNMLRVWGGGQYEQDWFYDLCDREGILVWQDFMFACHHYPAANPDWLALVKQEARQQIRRLSTHACLALWCGDNELIGALNWFQETRTNRDRYLANYVILNHTLSEAMADEGVDTPFWPSSPSSGHLDFGDAWHDDRAGDMHFWDVWHAAMDFEHYRSVKPRFCSEFGFQSLPSLPTIARFTEPEDRNISSPVMESHQRNPGGNSRIVETIARYFRFPERFEDQVFLSQVAQGMALQTAIEFWRCNKPHTMGTLYWQLNDAWPGASWSSLEHGGAWKISHYLARRFYAPVLISVQPDSRGEAIVVYAVADNPGGCNLTLTLSLEGLDGTQSSCSRHEITIPDDRVVAVTRFPLKEIEAQTFLLITWTDEQGVHRGETTYFPQRFKRYDLPRARIDGRLEEGRDGPVLILETSLPAFYVTIGLGGPIIYSDNAMTLLPGRPKTIHPCPIGDRARCHEAFANGLPTMQHLAGSGMARRA